MDWQWPAPAPRFGYADSMQPHSPAPSGSPHTRADSVDTRLRVRYAETDQMGVVYYANYLIWMEIGRVEFCRSSGIRYRDIEADGFLLVVAEANCRYLSPAHYDDEILIVTTMGDASPRMPRFDYEIANTATGHKLAKGYTKHIWCTADFRPQKLPAQYWPAFGIKSGPAST